MNVQLNMIPRLDSSTGAGMLDIAALGQPTAHGKYTSFSKLGAPITSTGPAVRQVGEMLAKKWKHLDGFDERVVQDRATEFVCGRDRQDGATDFVTSGLRGMLGPAEDVDRSEDREWIFVARPGSPAILPTRNLLRPGMRSTAYRVRELTGQAQFTDPNDLRSLQRASSAVEEKDIIASYYGIMWSISVPETWEADILGEGLLADRQRAATLALDEFQESVTGWGNVERKLPGLFTMGDAVKIMSGQQFASGAVDPDDQLRRLRHAEQLFMRYNGGRKPTRAIIPEDDLATMQTTWFGTGGEGPSVWDRAVGYMGVKPMFPWLAAAVSTERLNDGNETGDASRWVLLGNVGNDLFVENTPTMLFGPFPDMLDMTFVALRRTGGVVAKKPENVVYLEFSA